MDRLRKDTTIEPPSRSISDVDYLSLWGLLERVGGRTSRAVRLGWLPSWNTSVVEKLLASRRKYRWAVAPRRAGTFWEAQQWFLRSLSGRGEVNAHCLEPFSSTATQPRSHANRLTVSSPLSPLMAMDLAKMVACRRIFPERAVVAALPLYPLMAIESVKVSAVAQRLLVSPPVPQHPKTDSRVRQATNGKARRAGEGTALPNCHQIPSSPRRYR